MVYMKQISASRVNANRGQIHVAVVNILAKGQDDVPF